MKFTAFALTSLLSSAAAFGVAVSNLLCKHFDKLSFNFD